MEHRLLEQPSLLQVWSVSDEPVLVVGERDAVITKKRSVLEAYLKRVGENFSERFSSLQAGYDDIRKKNDFLILENRGLKSQLRRLSKRISNLEEKISQIAEERIIVVREITREEAEEEIKDLFKSGGTFYYSEIAEKLQLDLELVVEICQDLMQKGEIEISEHSL